MTKLPVPIAIMDQNTVVLGKTRSGKSSAMRLLVEAKLDDDQPVCIIDPKGDWWGLKLAASGKAAGFPVVLFGGDHADVPINRAAGASIAELIAGANRSCIIDLGQLMVSERTQFFLDFASTLFRLTRGRRWLVIDECHNFAPQGKVYDPQSGKMLHWANKLASEGSGRGLILLSASQRPQKVHKDYLTSHETLIAKRVIHPLDRNAVKEWIDGSEDPDAGAEVLRSLAGMDRSEAWVWSPEIKFGPKRVSFPMFRTYDSFKPADHSAPAKLTGWAAVDLADVTAKLGAVIAEAKANDPAELRREIARLATELRNAGKQLPGKIEVKMADSKAVARDREALYRQGQLAGQTLGWINGHQAGFRAGVSAARAAFNFGDPIYKQEPPPKYKPVDPVPAYEGRVALAAPAAPAPARPAPKQALGRGMESLMAEQAGAGSLTGPQRELLAGLAWWAAHGHSSVSRAQLAGKCSWKVKGSHLRNRLAELRSAGLIDYVGNGVGLTPAGHAAAPAPDLSADLLTSVRAILSGPQLQLFDILGHNDQTRAEIAERLNWEPGGSHLRNRLAELSALELIEYPQRGTVALQEWVRD